MPCYLEGQLTINEENVQKALDNLGWRLEREGNHYWIKNQDGLPVLKVDYLDMMYGTPQIYQAMQQAQVNKIKKEAVKKGWKIKSIKSEKDKIRIRLTE